MNVREIILLVLLVLSFVLIIYVYHQERKFAKTYLYLADLYKAQVDYLIKLTENQMLANVDLYLEYKNDMEKLHEETQRLINEQQEEI